MDNVITLATGLFFLGFNSIVNPPAYKNNIVLLKSENKSGNSFLVNYKSQKFILTNSHICLDNYFLEYYKTHDISLLNKKIDFNLYQNSKKIDVISYTIKDLLVNTKLDICAIPVNNTSFSYYELDDKEINEKSIKKIEIGSYHAYINHRKEFKTFFGVKNGKLRSIRGSEYEISYKNDKIKHSGIYGIYYINLKEGESGSPVFSDSKFAGLAYGIKKTDDNTYGMIVYKNDILLLLNKKIDYK